MFEKHKIYAILDLSTKISEIFIFYYTFYKKERKMNEVGYHGTCSKYQASIENDGFDPDKCKYRDDHWLGQGVYFFDDLDKAIWWASTIAYKNPNSSAIVFKVIIDAKDEEVLDLTDKEQLDIFLEASIKLIKEVEMNQPDKMPVFNDKKFRAVLFDYYKQQNNISVIIGVFSKDFAGYTEKRNSQDINIQRKIENIIGIKFLERQLCVSKKECISISKLVYNENEEVI